MININSKTGKRKQQREMDRLITGLTLIQAKGLKPIFNRQYLLAAKEIERGAGNIGSSIESEAFTLKKRLRLHYKRVGSVFSEKVFNSIQKGLQPPEEKGAATGFWVGMNTWINTQTARRVTDIQETTRSKLNSIIASGFEEGLSNDEIAKAIRRKTKITNPFRARMIARTETHSASMFAMDNAVATTGIEMEGEWVTAGDGRVRGGLKSAFNHRKVNGQRRKQGVAFDVSGEKLMYPGDPNGSAGNIIQCRCVKLYHTVRRRRK